MDERDEREMFHGRKADKTYFASSFPSLIGRKRIANKVIDGPPGFEFATVREEMVLRETDAGRFQIKVTFTESDRSFGTVTIQKFTDKGNAKQYFSFGPSEVDTLLRFFANIKRVHFPHEGKFYITDSDLEDLLMRPDQAKRLAAANPALLAALARTEITTEDIVALGFRKRQLKVFERLLTDEEYFNAALAKCNGPEDVWQRYFERNPWIFGYGLSLINFGPLDRRKMEQVVKGFSITGSGKRVDALLKSNALLSTTCFVEIKRHDTELVAENTYRSGIWQPTRELSGAVAQVQGTVSAAIESWRAKEDIADLGSGEPTGETVFTTEPRSFVICGQLSEFQAEKGVNERKFRSFELYRRNLVRPEIVTFDELFQRARLIVEAQHDAAEA